MIIIDSYGVLWYKFKTYSSYYMMGEKMGNKRTNWMDLSGGVIALPLKADDEYDDEAKIILSLSTFLLKHWVYPVRIIFLKRRLATRN